VIPELNLKGRITGMSENDILNWGTSINEDGFCLKWQNFTRNHHDNEINSEFR
jgi:hypothetical protein